MSETLSLGGHSIVYKTQIAFYSFFYLMEQLLDQTKTHPKTTVSWDIFIFLFRIKAICSFSSCLFLTSISPCLMFTYIILVAESNLNCRAVFIAVSVFSPGDFIILIFVGGTCNFYCKLALNFSIDTQVFGIHKVYFLFVLYNVGLCEHKSND